MTTATPSSRPTSKTRLLPGLVLAGAATAFALQAHHWWSPLPALPLCVALGVALSNLAGVPEPLAPGLGLAAGWLLRAGVILLGFDLVFPDVVNLGAKALAVVVAVVALT